MTGRKPLVTMLSSSEQSSSEHGTSASNGIVAAPKPQEASGEWRNILTSESAEQLVDRVVRLTASSGWLTAVFIESDVDSLHGTPEFCRSASLGNTL